MTRPAGSRGQQRRERSHRRIDRIRRRRLHRDALARHDRGLPRRRKRARRRPSARRAALRGRGGSGGVDRDRGRVAGERFCFAGGLSLRPGPRSRQRIASLPTATTHAAAASLGGTVFVIGGRGAALGSVSYAIVAIEPRTGHSVAAGRLKVGAQRPCRRLRRARILIAGGATRRGVTDAISELVAGGPNAHPRGRSRRERLCGRSGERAHRCRAQGARPRLRPEQPVGNARRHRSALVQGDRPLPRRLASPARDAVLRPAHALRRQRPLEQPHADQSGDRTARGRADPGHRSVQPLLHAERPLRNRRRGGPRPPRLPNGTRHATDAFARGAVPWGRSHGFHRRWLDCCLRAANSRASCSSSTWHASASCAFCPSPTRACPRT